MNSRHFPIQFSNSSTFAIVKEKVFEALSAEYKTIEIDIAVVESTHYSKFQSLTRDNGIQLWFVIHQNQHTEVAFNSAQLEDAAGAIFVFSEILTRDDKYLLTRLGSKLKAVRCKTEDPARYLHLVKSLPLSYRKILETEFSYLPNPSNVDCVLIHDAISAAKSKLPSLVILPPGHTDVPNPDVSNNRSIEPNYPPVAVINHQAEKPQVSVVIPTYNNWNRLRQTLLQFTEQTLCESGFELIVVDDGSSDDTNHKLYPLLKQLGLRSTLLRHPRARVRGPGTKGYSAGIARNYGVKHASADILFFMDSDIMIADTMLEDLIELHKKFDVIQGKRFELNRRDSKQLRFYDQISKGRRTDLEDSVFWGSFYNNDDNLKKWVDQPAPWRFVCSHSLSIKKVHFVQSGRFRSTFCHYGFEDTDLGYRLFHSGFDKFHLYRKPVYHCYQSKSLSEYSNSHWKKLKVLRKSARVFYRNTLDEQVFEYCEPYFKTNTPKTVVRHWLYTILQSLGQHRIFQKFVYAVFQARAKTEKSRNAAPLRHEA